MDDADTLYKYVFYILMLMTFWKPISDLRSFKRNLSFSNDCVDSKAF